LFANTTRILIGMNRIAVKACHFLYKVQ